jgi:hypothetical protein
MPKDRPSSAWTGVLVFFLIVLTLAGFLIILILLHLRGQRSPQPKANSASIDCANLGDIDSSEADAMMPVFPAAFPWWQIR